MRPSPRFHLSSERRLFLLALAVGLPGSILGLALLWTSNLPPSTQWTLTILLAISWVGLAALVRRRAVYSLRSISSLLEALRQEDYSLRGRRQDVNDALDDVFREINLLSESLSDQRLSALEASALLRAVMAEIDKVEIERGVGSILASLAAAALALFGLVIVTVATLRDAASADHVLAGSTDIDIDAG